jgi:hypothetical protein
MDELLQKAIGELRLKQSNLVLDYINDQISIFEATNNIVHVKGDDLEALRQRMVKAKQAVSEIRNSVTEAKRWMTERGG